MFLEPAFPARYAWADAYMQAKPLAFRDYKASWKAVRYFVQDKIFALLFRDNKNRLILNLKCDPYLALYYRAEYSHVGPGYHMNKLHWNTVYLEGATPDDVVRELVDVSYRLVCAGLSKKAQEQIARALE